MAASQSFLTTSPEDPNRKVLQQYFNVKSSFALATADGTSATQHDIDGIGEYLSSRIAPIYYNERRLPDSTAATEAFGIPELLEMVLDYTTFADIVCMTRTCREIKEFIDGSPKLQARLGLISRGQIEDNGVKLQTPFRREYKHARETFRYEDYSLTFSTNIGSEPWPYGKILFITPKPHKTHFNVYVSEEASEEPSMGETWKHAFISQPPIKTMDVTLRCHTFGCLAHDLEQDDLELGPRTERMYVETGITLGHILERAIKLLKQPCVPRFLLPGEIDEQRLDGHIFFEAWIPEGV